MVIFIFYADEKICHHPQWIKTANIHKFENNIFDYQIKRLSNSLNVEILHTTKIIVLGGLSSGKNR